MIAGRSFFYAWMGFVLPGVLSCAGVRLAGAVPHHLQDAIERHCLDCHDSSDAKGEVNLELIFDAPEQFANNGRLLELLEPEPPTPSSYEPSRRPRSTRRPRRDSSER